MCPSELFYFVYLSVIVEGPTTEQYPRNWFGLSTDSHDSDSTTTDQIT